MVDFTTMSSPSSFCSNIDRQTERQREKKHRYRFSNPCIYTTSLYIYYVDTWAPAGIFVGGSEP